MDGIKTVEDNKTTAHRTTRYTVQALEKQGYLHRIKFRPPGFTGEGKYPQAIWLSKQGVEWCEENLDPALDPKAHIEDRSELNIIHDLMRSDCRIAIYELARKNAIDIGWRKSDIFHRAKPDDLFELTRGKTFHFFLEFERKKKALEEMYEKLRRYNELYGTALCKQFYGFRYFTVIIPMRSERAKTNLLLHLEGKCNCLDPKAKKLHASSLFKMNISHFYFTTHEAMQSPSFLLDFVQ